MEDEDKEKDIDKYWPPPITKSVEFVASVTSKTLSALAINSSGTRFATGGHDQQVNIWDFAALDPARPAPIANCHPCEQTVINSLSYSKDENFILVVPANCQAKIIAKDGLSNDKLQCPKGDQYLTDMSKTKGHVQMLNDGCWNPEASDTFISCSNDGTIRIWNFNDKIEQKTVIKTRSPISGLKSIPTTCKYSSDALLITAGCNDGCIMMWDTRRKFITTSSCIKNAHSKGNEITGLSFSYSSKDICTRSEDGTLKLWDLRQLKSPTSVKDNLRTDYSSMSCCFSPDDKYILAGTSSTNDLPGRLLFLSSDALEEKESIEVPDASILACLWHPKINQILYTCSNGALYLHYDPEKSIEGIKSANGQYRGYKRKRFGMQSDVKIQKIITPHSLPLFKDDNMIEGKSAIIRARHNAHQSYKPEMPSASSSFGNRIAPAGSTLSSFIAQKLASSEEK